MIFRPVKENRKKWYPEQNAQAYFGQTFNYLSQNITVDTKECEQIIRPSTVENNFTLQQDITDIWTMQQNNGYGERGLRSFRRNSTLTSELRSYRPNWNHWPDCSSIACTRQEEICRRNKEWGSHYHGASIKSIAVDRFTEVLDVGFISGEEGSDRMFYTESQPGFWW